jgi:Predicted membrane protein
MDVVFRATAAYVFIIFILRVIGRRELSDLGPSDIVLLVVMGDLVQNGVTQADDSVTGMFLAISTFGVLTVGLSYLTFRVRGAKILVEGAPVILLQDGMPLPDNLRKERLTIDDLCEQARGQGIEKLDDVKWCVLESSGQLSFVKKSG